MSDDTPDLEDLLRAHVRTMIEEVIPAIERDERKNVLAAAEIRFYPLFD